MKTNKKYSLTTALQAGAAHDFALFKSRRQFRREASGKKPYMPGSIGLSTISSAIKKEFGNILSRKERKQLAKESNQPFQKFYAQG